MKKTVIFAIFMFIFLFCGMIVHAAFGGHVSTVSDDDSVSITNNLRIEHVHSNYTINITGINNGNSYIRSVATGQYPDCLENSDFVTQDVFCYRDVLKDRNGNHYSAQNIKSISIPYADRANAIIKITYDKVGKYNGQDVGAIMTIDKIPASEVENRNANFQLSNSLYEGLHYQYAQGHRQTYQFFYTSDSSRNIINLDNSYVSLNSNNVFFYSNPDE